MDKTAEGSKPQSWAYAWYAIRADTYRATGGSGALLVVRRFFSDPLARHLIVWRIGSWAQRSGRRTIVRKLAGWRNRRSTLRCGVEIPFGTSIGPGLRINHRIGGILLNEGARLGASVTLTPGVVIGNNAGRPGAPTIGDGVVLHVGSKVIGAVTVGAGSQVGANSVVTRDVPPDSVAAGVPARVLEGHVPHRAGRTDLAQALGPVPAR